MRLPALTKQQEQREAARDFHERLWTAYETRRTLGEGGGLVIPTTPGRVMPDMLTVSRRATWFWRDRGFRVRVKVTATKTAILIWLEPRA